MKRIGILLCLLMVVMGLSISAQGALVDMQDGTIYDTDTQLSWLKDGDATGIRPLSWYDAIAWAESLNADGGFAGLTGWRLPHADPACGRNYNCFNSEMGHLYYIELGNVAWGSPINTGPFTNMEPLGFYWTDTEYAPQPDSAWGFGFYNGGQDIDHKTAVSVNAWGVRPGVRYTGGDTDSDGVPDSTDNCMSVQNPDQSDIDNDGKGDVCDICPHDRDNDIDGDGICGDVDNCPLISNPTQADTDADGIGDACEPALSDELPNSYPIAVCMDACGYCFWPNICELYPPKVLTTNLNMPYSDTFAWTTLTEQATSSAYLNEMICTGTPFQDTCGQSIWTITGTSSLAFKNFKSAMFDPTFDASNKEKDFMGNVIGWNILVPVTNDCPPGNQISYPSNTWGYAQMHLMAVCGLGTGCRGYYSPPGICGGYPYNSIIVDQISCFSCGGIPQLMILPPNLPWHPIFFGAIYVGETSTMQEVRISNWGSNILHISEVNIEGSDAPDFTIQNNNCSARVLPPSSECTIELVFSPTSGGDKNATLVLISNDPTNPVTEVPLNGWGVVSAYNLSVTNLTGSGIVSAIGIVCPSDCTESYDSGTTVELTAIPDNGWYFDSWAGDISGNVNPNGLLMDSDKNIMATFKEIDTDIDGVPDSRDNCPLAQNLDQSDVDYDGKGDVCDVCPNDTENDVDSDGICGNIDNCPTVSNASQLDSDGDGKGDMCDNCPYDKDDDIDGDSVCGDLDNCPLMSNPTQADADADGIGNACDTCPYDKDNDADGDGICGNLDNCPHMANADQNDSDHDGLGDACDPCPLDSLNDADGDGVCGNVDNCPNMSNPDQTDTDQDGIGDACDSCPYDSQNDIDLDGICGNVDNCPQISNPNQENADGDSLGNACDACPNDAENDVDADGVCGDIDNCPLIPNANQDDEDGDSIGDECDSCPDDANNDIDGDTICGDTDNCPDVANTDQADTDGDGMGDTCDICPFDAQNDADADGVCGDIDNCRQVANTDQNDSDSDGIGNACDSCPFDANNDIDGDTICGDLDNCSFVANPNQADMDKDGIGDACDNDADGDGFVKGVDCNDLNPLINPFACDIRNDGIDQDCDGKDRTKGQPCVGEADGDLKELACNDRIDNDKDGLIDCADPDCARKKECR